jgi:predicted outer membrane protein
MTPQFILKQMLTFQKTTFDNSFNSMIMLQQQTENLLKEYTEKADWLPSEGKEAIESWINAYKMGREKFKKDVDVSFDKITEIIK